MDYDDDSDGYETLKFVTDLLKDKNRDDELFQKIKCSAAAQKANLRALY